MPVWLQSVKRGMRAALCVAVFGGLAGCPVGAELEDPERFGRRTASGGTTGTAGTSGSSSVPSELPVLPAPCEDWQTAVKKSCATPGCHGVREPSAGLNLTPDEQFVQRIKDQPATNKDVDCDPSDGFMACASPPLECSNFATAKLIDSANPEASYLLIKMTASGCGNQMPLNPGNSASVGWSDERKTCLETLWRSIAAL